ncbi:exonuclease SbcCD subunit D C-terminal domain-containing protein [Aureispira sp. CCB-E]|uniref:exonuclease SbcCD subunit D C-terminal domain-containing protein n=1 Tax=Aureispira sp. CCB-E TaxID=3051121 RepID=UPI0028689A74|nr:exonuclease SbcCD subunit D C-terminal domain-containing protein [Aureispira sp. CCB-E]WMX16897.1 exonuclease SbcCD subunit D C-terminal domain-containing protein [Aureispira sp. CCB-E]
MKLLHTADWHLGQKFFHRNREQEHRAALDWLVQYIIQEGVELLVVAGDIFDTDSPPNYARKLYFNFLKQLVNTCCEDIVIVAGNHDSANMLDASKELFKLLNVHVVGHISDDRAAQIIEIRGKEEGALKAVVGAVPYLRDKDIRKSISGETYEERVENLRQGIQQHYQEIEAALTPYQNLAIPVIVTGHLYAAGGQRDDRPNSIHIGSLDIIKAENFSKDFDYVALGHLHRYQQIDKNRPIWYSGALIPLDFSELNYAQVVRIIEFQNKNILHQQSVKVPLKRKMRTYKGNLAYIKEKLSTLDTNVPLDTWLKIEVETAHYSPDLLSDLEEIIQDKPAEIIILNQRAIQNRSIDSEHYQNLQSLQDMDEIEVFRMCAQQKGQIETEELTELENSFKELLGWMQERDVE